MSQDLSAWTDSNGDFILIGNHDCKPGDPLISVPADLDTVVAWFMALVKLLDDAALVDLPGEFTKCGSSDEV